MVTLTYPYGSPTRTIQLPNPELGDALEMEEPFNLDWSISGRVYTYKKSENLKKLLLTFTNLTFTQQANLKLFLYNAVGAQSGYLDHRATQWQGVFMNDPFEQSNIHRNYSNITLEFRGRRV